MEFERRKRAGADGGFTAMPVHADETAGPRTAEWPNPIPLFSRSHPTSGSRVPTTDLLRVINVSVDPFFFFWASDAPPTLLGLSADFFADPSVEGCRHNRY